MTLAMENQCVEKNYKWDVWGTKHPSGGGNCPLVSCSCVPACRCRLIRIADIARQNRNVTQSIGYFVTLAINCTQ